MQCPVSFSEKHRHTGEMETEGVMHLQVKEQRGSQQLQRQKEDTPEGPSPEGCGGNAAP